MRTDLHIHTTASDGTWHPAQVIEVVQDAGIELFAVTDHDSVGNVLEVEKLARAAGISFIRGTEISCTLDSVLFHIVAYGIDPTRRELRGFLARNEQLLMSTDEKSLQILIDAGHEIDLNAYAAYEYDRCRGGWKALNFLIDLGLCADVRDFFERLFPDDYHVPFPTFPDPAEVIELIHRAGGIAILAHPGGSTRRIPERRAELFTQMLERGVSGLECFSSYHDAATTRYCLDFCDRHDMLITGGSDSHGAFTAHRQIGIPEVYVSDLRLGEIAEFIV